MSDELDTHEQRLADLFNQVSAPPSMRRWESGAVGRAGSWWSRPLRALVSAGGETRLRPLAAALVLPVTVLAVTGGLQIHTHFGGAAGQGGDPPARSGAAMAYDAAHHQVVMFGGTTGTGAGTELSDTWTWDGSSWTEQHPAVNPGAREGATMAFDAAHNEVVLYGGSEYRPPAWSGPVNDTWAWDGSNWHRVVTAHTPAADGTVGLAYDSQRSQLLLVVERVEPDFFGGGTGSASGSGSPAAGSLHGIAAPVPHPILMPTPAAPSSSTGGSAANVFGTISGGLTQGGAAGAAAPHAGVAPMPAEPQGVSLVPHGPPMQVNATLETWVFTGSDWQRLSPRSTPSVLPQVAMPAFDATAKHLVLLTSDVPPLQVHHPLCVVTTLAGGSGVSSSPTPAPSYPPGLPVGVPNARPLPPVSVPPVIAPAPVCPTATQGNVAPMRVKASPVEWAWDGSNWNQLPSSKGASAPFGVRLAGDPTTGRLLAVGALSTWTWTGSTWKLQQNPGGLARRAGFALAGDPDSNQVVLFGGRVAGIAGSDTWTWDGKKWTHRSGTTPPVPTPYPLPTPPAPATPTPCSQSVQFVQLSGGTVQVTITLPSPYTTAQCVDASGVVLTLIDASGKKAAITGNGYAMGNSIGATLSWSNWCGSPVTRALLDGKHVHMDAVVTQVPLCTDAHKPSTLTEVNITSVIP